MSGEALLRIGGVMAALCVFILAHAVLGHAGVKSGTRLLATSLVVVACAILSATFRGER